MPKITDFKKVKSQQDMQEYLAWFSTQGLERQETILKRMSDHLEAYASTDKARLIEQGLLSPLASEERTVETKARASAVDSYGRSRGGVRRRRRR